MTPAALVNFHTRHKFSVLAHDEPAYRELGRLVAGEYIRVLMRTLAKIATAKQHANVLTHSMGFLKADIDSDDKAELLDLIDAYRQQRVPLIVPMTLIQHHLRCHPNDSISAQYYITPHPREMMLRNRI